MTVKLRQLAYSSPPDLPDEQQRLEDLYALKVLDTAAEERYDQYTKLLTTVFRTPIALISFVDEDRQWFKSACGLTIDQTPREISFCAHAIAADSLFVIEDALEDERFAQHPAVLGEPKVRFYAGSVIRGPAGKPVGTCCVVDHEPRSLQPHERDALKQVTRLVEHELTMQLETADLSKRLQDAALIDSATGLPNLVLFSQRLGELVCIADARDQAFLLTLVRIDRFDALEAAIAREPASYLVRKLIERIEDMLFAPCLIGQIREDKLGLVIPLQNGETPERLLDNLLAIVDDPFHLGEHTVQLRLSIGASLYPRDATTVRNLLKRARTALWSKPFTDQSDYRLYRRRHSNAAMRSFKLESALKRALDRDEFHLVYQPKIDLQTGALVGAEALLRWVSDDIGAVPPSKFIPVAERSGLITEIGDWVTSSACAQLAHWDAHSISCPEIAVNMASAQLKRAGLRQQIQALLERHRLGAGRINLELTESSLVDDIGAAVRTMRQLRRSGVTLSIDDFGTGFSSLSYLRRMPVKTLKIDRSFVGTLPTNQDDMKLIRSIIAMGHSLGLAVVAEGVETEDQMNFLWSAGCDQGQGYLFSRPLIASDFEAYLRRMSSVSSGNRANSL